MSIINQAENITIDNSKKTIIDYYNEEGEAVHKAKEIHKTENKIIIYPYYVNRTTKKITKKSIVSIEFDGWNSLIDLPNDFKKSYGSTTYYDIYSSRLKEISKFIAFNKKSVNKLVFSMTKATRFNKNTITFNWPELEEKLGIIGQTLTNNNRYKKHIVESTLSSLTSTVKVPRLKAKKGELSDFIKLFDSWDNFSSDDVKSIGSIIESLPASKISVTQNFIETQTKINVAYFESILKGFQKLKAVNADNEKDWQKFFESYSWILNHLFPFEVLIRDREAYVGGKTLSNKDGKVVDFLLENGFKDNFALIEIKTHKKLLLKNTAYRGTDVFAMTEDFSGGISQALDQKNVFMTEFGQKESILDPKCILIIGLKNSLNAEQRKCFELIRNNQKNVEIVTFDELEDKMKGLLKVISQR